MKYNFTEKELEQLANFTNEIIRLHNRVGKNYNINNIYKIFLYATEKELKEVKNKIICAKHNIENYRGPDYNKGKTMIELYKEQYGYAVEYFKSLCSTYITNTNYIKKESM
jgi:hypothetical protein